jgi:nucleoid-associated protein YgaU
VKRNLRALLLIALVAVIVGVVLGVFLPGGDEDDAAPTSVASADKQPTATDNKTEEKREARAEPEVQPVEAPVAEAVPAETDAPAAAGVTPPSFDVVRVSPGGRAVIAGRAEPGAEVTVLDDGETLGTVQADKRGEWVLVPDKNLDPGDRQLSLVQETADGGQVASEQVVVLSVPRPKAKPAGTAADSGATAQQGAESAETAEEGVVAVLVERDGEGPSKILQSPEVGGEGIGDESEVTVRSVDYDDKGEVTLAGRTEPEAVVNVYVDEEYVGSAKASEEGDWQLSPDADVAPGQHKLRVDKIDSAGAVLARIETPISRARPEELLLGDALVVVQPGNSLWRIARRAYGGGIYYSEIYSANRASILDPNLIFPGQILTLPVLN